MEFWHGLALVWSWFGLVWVGLSMKLSEEEGIFREPHRQAEPNQAKPGPNQDQTRTKPGPNQEHKRERQRARARERERGIATASERERERVYGPSCTGKSRMARSLFGDGRTLVVDVQHAAHPDLRAYRRGLHKAVLLDEMASPEFIVTNKKLLQAHVDGAILGHSSTQLFTYELFLWRTPLMITTNNFDYSAFSAADKDWLESNCVAVYVGQPVWKVLRSSGHLLQHLRRSRV